MDRITARERYIDTGMATVPGWLTAENARLFACVSDLQHTRGVMGDLLEIGVFKGASAILLGFLAYEGEAVIVSDLFGTPYDAPRDVKFEMTAYAGNELSDFLEHWRRFHRRDPHDVFVGPSERLHHREWDRPVRFVHIDGGHSFDVVERDLELAKRVLVPGGVVVFDDARASGTPGVRAAAWGAVANSGLVPFAETKKLYATWDEALAEHAAAEISRRFRSIEHRIHGRPMIQVRGRPNMTTAQKWVPPGLVPFARAARGVASRRFTRRPT